MYSVVSWYSSSPIGERGGTYEQRVGLGGLSSVGSLLFAVPVWVVLVVGMPLDGGALGCELLGVLVGRDTCTSACVVAVGHCGLFPH